MPCPIWFALVLVTLCALLWDAGIVLQKLAVDRLPRIGLGPRVRRRSPVALHTRDAGWPALPPPRPAGACSPSRCPSLPCLVARAIQGSGFVVLAVFSLLFLRHRLVAQEWTGVALVTLGIAALGLVNSSSPGVPAVLSAGHLAAAVGACLLVCAAASALPRILKERVPPVIAFSIVAGTLLGLGDVSTKVLIGMLQGRAAALPMAAAGACLIAFYISGFLVLSRAYQHGRAILVTAASDLCSRLVAVVVGVAALGESLAADRRLRWIALLGYAGIITGAVLLARFSGGEMAAALARPGEDDVPANDGGGG